MHHNLQTCCHHQQLKINGNWPILGFKTKLLESQTQSRQLSLTTLGWTTIYASLFFTFFLVQTIPTP